MDKTGDLLTPVEAREYLRLSQASFYRIAAPHLHRVRLGARSVRYRRADIEAFVARTTEATNVE